MEHTSGLTIDWRLLLLQAGNFLVLMVILSWLVWKPLVAMIDERRRTIREGLLAAEAQKKAAAEAENMRTELLKKAKAEAAELVSETRDQLKQERDKARGELKLAEERMQKKMTEELAAGRAKLLAEVRTSVAKIVIQAVGRVLSNLPEDPKQVTNLVTNSLKELE